MRSSGGKDSIFSISTVSVKDNVKEIRSKRAPLKLGDVVFDWSRTYVMGVINITPDSFSDGGSFVHFEGDSFAVEQGNGSKGKGATGGLNKWNTSTRGPIECSKASAGGVAVPNVKKAVECGLSMIEAGADILDIGGESTRPGSDPVSEEEEKKRVIPVIRGLLEAVPGHKSVNNIPPLSIDTYKSGVAQSAIEAGASLINDVSGLTLDAKLAYVAAETGVPIVLGHIRGTPKNMQKKVGYKDLIQDVSAELELSMKKAMEAGVEFEKIILDPGIGFGKSPDNNLELILESGNLGKTLGRPVLVGASRKSFIGRFTGAPVHDRLPGSIAAGVMAAFHGAQILRVHDVKETRQAVRMVDAFKKFKRVQ